MLSPTNLFSFLVENIKSHRKFVIVVIAIVVVLLAAFGGMYLYNNYIASDEAEEETVATTDEGETVAAVANGQNITEEQVSEYIAQYREYAGLEDDSDWATFLDEAQLTAEELRENAIQYFAERIAVEDKATAIGITVSEEELDASVVAAQSSAGYENDDEGWEEYLATISYTVESYREDVRLTLLEELLIRDQVDAATPSDDVVLAYANLNSDDYTGKYVYVVAFPSNASQAAAAFTTSVADITTEAEFLEFGAEAVDNGSATSSGIWGWTCLDDDASTTYLEAVDVVAVGAASIVTDDDGSILVFFVAQQYVSDDNGYVDLTTMPDEIYSALYSDVASYQTSYAGEEYLDELISNALTEIYDMPDGLDYDVDMSLSTYKVDITVNEEDIESAAANQVSEISNTASGDE